MGVLQVLFHFPELPDINVLINKAIDVKEQLKGNKSPESKPVPLQSTNGFDRP